MLLVFILNLEVLMLMLCLPEPVLSFVLFFFPNQNCYTFKMAFVPLLLYILNGLCTAIVGKC